MVLKSTNQEDLDALEDLDDDNELISERKTWEALLKIKAMPIPMAEKKALKAQLTSLPTLKLKGWRLIKWRYLKIFKVFSRNLGHRWRNIIFLRKPLRAIEVTCGVSILNVFEFIKFTLTLNCIMFVVIALFIIIPFFANHNLHQGDKEYQNAVCPAPNGPFSTEAEMLHCCTKKFKGDLKDRFRKSLSTVVENLFKLQGGAVEDTPFFYGYYLSTIKYDFVEYNFDVAYVMVTALIYLFCLALMVRNIAMGFKEIILTKEGDNYQYANLIFGGWDYCTNNAAAFKYKRKLIISDMKIVLKTETAKMETIFKSHKDDMILRVCRILGHLIFFALWIFIGYAIYKTTLLSLSSARTSKDLAGTLLYFLQNFSPQITIILTNLISPIVLSWVGTIEKYSAQAQTTFTLLRALSIRMLGIGLPFFMFYQRRYCDIVHLTCTQCVNRSLEPRTTCWETLVSEVIYKLLLTDLTMKCIITFIIEPLKVFIAKKIPCAKVSAIRFNIVRHSLDLVYVQTLSWIGFYFSPVLPGIVAIYCFLVFFIKKFSVIHNCTEIPETLRTTRTTTLFMFAKLCSFVGATFIIVFVLGYMKSSIGCGPFRDFPTPWNAVEKSLLKKQLLHWLIINLVSPGVTTPVIILLLLGTYYYYSVAEANRDMVETLKHLLVLEGHDKQYLFAKLFALRKTNEAENGMKKNANAKDEEAKNPQ